MTLVRFAAPGTVHLVSTLVTILLLGASTAAQQAQHHLFTFRGDAAGDRFGFAITGAGDLDRDGLADVCVGAEAHNNQTGYIRVFSGAIGKELATVRGAASGDRFGFAVRDAGDVNNDGFPDLVVGAPGQATTPGYVQVISGLWIVTRGGPSVLHTFRGATAGDEFGLSVSGAGDLDKDGHADILIGARQNGVGTGYAQVRSGKTGNVMFTFPGGTGFVKYGRSISSAGDPNKDGYPDIIIGGAFLWRVMSGKDGTQLRQSRNQGGKSVSGAGDVNNDGYDDVMVYQGPSRNVVVFSGKDWSALYTLAAGGASPETTFFSQVGDVNKDGHSDVIVANGGNTLYPVSVYSGKSGTPLLQVKGPSTFGHSVSGAGDVNGDGTPDVLVGAPGTATTFGTAHVYSGALLALATDTHRVSLSKGGTQSLSLAAGAANANRPYWIFGSITGTRPGINLLGVHIPLVPDTYTDLALANVTVNPPFNRFRSTLDSNGAATASLIVPTGLPPTAFTLYHAFVVYDAQGRFHLASNAVSLRLSN